MTWKKASGFELGFWVKNICFLHAKNMFCRWIQAGITCLKLLTLAERMTHIRARSIFTARKSALLNGDPFKTLIFGKFWSNRHSSAIKNVNALKSRY